MKMKIKIKAIFHFAFSFGLVVFLSLPSDFVDFVDIMAFCKRMNVSKYDAEVTVEPSGQYSSRRTSSQLLKCY